MQKDRSFWSEWAKILHQSGFSDLAAVLLEAAGPVRILVAQALYAGRPFLGESAHLEALASLFEDRDESRSFAAFLREEIAG